MIARSPVREDQLFKWKKTQGYVFPMEPSEIFLKNTNILQEWLGKNTCCQYKMQKRDQDLLSNSFHHVIFSDKTKIMLYYNDGPQRAWLKLLRALEKKNLIPTVKFRKVFVMVWGCISSKGVGVIRILDEIITKEVYLKNELIDICYNLYYIYFIYSLITIQLQIIF